MTEDWKSYFSNVNDKFASIALNLGLRPSVPMSDKPWLLWVWIYLQSPNAEGLTTNSEAKVIWGIEKELEKVLDAGCGGIYCGRITTDGKRELYFYGKTDSGFEAAVRAVMSSFGGYQFDLGTQREPDWNQYLNVLFPSDEDMQRIGNRDVLETFEKQGDMLEAEREVQHWIYFRRKIDLDWFVQAAQQRGYKTANDGDNAESDRPFGLRVIRVQSISQTEIDNTVIELFRLAKIVNGLYDGWEAQVAGNQVP
jgi:uncharacterized protein (TIGR01619 family)